MIRLYDNPSQKMIRLYSSDAPETSHKSPEPSFAMQNFPGTMEGLSSIQNDPLNLKADPSQPGNDIVTGIKNSITDLADTANKAIGFTTADTGERIKAGIEVIPKTAGALFSPISSLFSAATRLPIFGTAAKLVNTAFTALGEAGSGAVKATIDAIPDKAFHSIGIEDAAKAREIIKPGLQEIGALATQLIGGELVHNMLPSVKAEKLRLKEVELAKKYGPEDAKIIVEKAQEIAQPKTEAPKKIRLYPEEEKLPRIKMVATSDTKIVELRTQIENLRQTLDNSPVKNLVKYANSKGELPGVTGYGKSEFARRGDQIVTEFGFNSPEEAQTALDSYNQSRQKIDQLTGEFRKAKGTLKDYTPEDLDRINSLLSSTEEGVNTHYETYSIEGTGDTRTRGLGSGVEIKAIENKLTNGFGELPEYQAVSMADQAIKASDLLTKDPDQTRRIAMGFEPAPQGLIPEAIFIALENLAIKEGDVAMLRDLATKSNLVTEATTMGQRIRTLAERDPDSPTGAIKEVQRVREEKTMQGLKGKELKTVIKETTADIAKEIKKVSPTKETWNTFIDSLSC